MKKKSQRITIKKTDKYRKHREVQENNVIFLLTNCLKILYNS